MPPRIQVYLVSRHPDVWTSKKFEGLAAQFRSYPVDFSILGITGTLSGKAVFIRNYETLHLKMPLHFIDENQLQAFSLNAHTYDDYICILWGGKLIYKGAAVPTQHATRFLFKDITAMNISIKTLLALAVLLLPACKRNPSTPYVQKKCTKRLSASNKRAT